MTKPSRLDAGTIVAGRYRVEREIGRGGMAQVYEARHTDIGKGVAVKVLAAEFASSPVVVERFLREARAAAAVHSPYICDVYDSGKLDDGRPFLVMELLRGESLYERMVKIRQFDAETTARVVTHVSRGLMKAHAANIVHRDLKPENIFLTIDEEGDLRAKVLDFGLAKFYAPTNDGDAASARLTREGAIFGTPAYMSPEQVQGQGTVDHRADLWALGCIAYECLTGRTVWATDKGIAMTFAQIASAPLPKILRYRPDLPPTLEEWFERALSRDADVRFQTAKELAEHFNAAINQGSPSLMFGEISRVGPSPISDELARQYAQGDASPAAPSSKRRPAAGEPAVPSGEVISLGETPRAPSVMPSHPVTDPLPVSLLSPGDAPHTQPSPDTRVESLPGDLGSSNTVKRPAPLGRRSRWPLVLVGVVGVAGGAVGAWQTMRSMGKDQPAASASASASTAPSAGASTAPEASSAAPPPADSALLANAPRWWPLVQEGQARVLAGDLPEAARRFKEAQDTMSSAVGKSMLDHVTVARDSKGPCRLSAISRVRSPLVSSQSAGQPALVATSKGLLVLWSDDHETMTHDHVYAQLLDAATLRPRGTPVDVTPEADRVARFSAVRVGERVALLYAIRGTQQGLFLRWLEADGQVAEAARPVSGAKAAAGVPSLSLDGNDLWGAWDERGDGDRVDLMMAKLSAGTPAVRALDLKPGRFNARVQGPSLASSGGNLLAAFRVDRDASKPIMLLQAPASAPGLSAGLPVGKIPPREDGSVGHLATLTQIKDKTDLPGVACNRETCFVSWHIEPAGSMSAFSVAQVNPQKGDVPWTKRIAFTGNGGRPSLGVSDSEAVLAWYDNNRIVLAPLSGREQLGERSMLAHAASDRPPAAVASLGAKTWAVAWLDFEKGKLEPYVLRATCR